MMTPLINMCTGKRNSMFLFLLIKREVKSISTLSHDNVEHCETMIIINLQQNLKVYWKLIINDPTKLKGVICDQRMLEVEKTSGNNILYVL